MLKNQKGITLVALVITVIVLLILAGVTLRMVIGPSGVIEQTNNTKVQVEKSEIRDNVTPAISACVMKYQEEGYMGYEGDPSDENALAASLAQYVETDCMNPDGNIAKSLPEGYKVTSAKIENETTVKLGVSVSDVAYVLVFDAKTQEVTVE